MPLYNKADKIKVSRAIAERMKCYFGIDIVFNKARITLKGMKIERLSTDTYKAYSCFIEIVFTLSDVHISTVKEPLHKLILNSYGGCYAV